MILKSQYVKHVYARLKRVQVGKNDAILGNDDLIYYLMECQINIGQPTRTYTTRRNSWLALERILSNQIQGIVPPDLFSINHDIKI